MKGWYNEGYRHSLAAKGIRTSMFKKNFQIVFTSRDGGRRGGVAEEAAELLRGQEEEIKGLQFRESALEQEAAQREALREQMKQITQAPSAEIRLIMPEYEPGVEEEEPQRGMTFEQFKQFAAQMLEAKEAAEEVSQRPSMGVPAKEEQKEREMKVPEEEEIIYVPPRGAGFIRKGKRKITIPNEKIKRKVEDIRRAEILKRLASGESVSEEAISIIKPIRPEIIDVGIKLKPKELEEQKPAELETYGERPYKPKGLETYGKKFDVKGLLKKFKR